MATVKVEDGDDYTGKHVVIHCGTLELWACDTEAERDALVIKHNEEA